MRIENFKDDKSPIVAVYRARCDGDYEFVAAFCRAEMPMLSQADSDQTNAMVESLIGALNEENEDAIVIGFDEPNMPSVWDGEPGSTTKEL
jgi:hypothetical protein